jgi:GSCFA family
MTNPYRDLEDYQFWSKAMSWPAPGRVDPVVKGGKIELAHNVSTMGSCFAQHISKKIRVSGLNYFVPEAAPPDVSDELAISMNYGVFSARYGNIYTVRQAIQLFDRAFGAFQPVDDVWESKGGFVDAFRPRIQPVPHSSAEAVRESAAEHLGFVRRVFLESDWLVFTLGLTETWESKLDGAIYPVAPGVAGGEFDSVAYKFRNFSASEVTEDLHGFLDRVHKINPLLRVILTVSPVPLIATYESRHVWVSTTFSKAALRVAADVAEREFNFVTYFPSYEVITSPSTDGRYYDDDLRQIREIGVNHVMRLFGEHFFPFEENVGSIQYFGEHVDLIGSREIVCEEEIIERSLKESGFGHRD